MTSKYLIISFTFLWLATLMHASYSAYQKTQFLGYWKEQNTNHERLPASTTNLSEDAVALYRDYFSYDEFHKYLSYKITLESFPKEHDSLVQRSLEEILIGTESAQPLKGRGIERLEVGLKTLLKEELLSKLIINLAQKAGGQKPIRLNLNFTSQVTPEFNFKRELASNSTIHWNQTGNLSKKINLIRPQLHLHVFETALPSQAQYYQYHGGQISLWYSPKNEKGLIRYRRYFRSPALAKAKPFSNKADFRVNLVHFKSLESRFPGAYEQGRFVTADIYESFERDTPKPKLDRLEIFFGKLLSSEFSNKEQLKGLHGSENSALVTDELNLHGVIKHHGKELMFTSQVEELVYDFKKEKFTAQSKIKSQIKGKSHATGEIQQKIYHSLLRENVIKFIQAIGLRQIYSNIGDKS